jgi:hypothetical protein
MKMSYFYNPMETMFFKTAWMPCPLPSCALYEKTAEITVDPGVCLVVILGRLAMRHDVVTHGRRLSHDFGSVAFFKDS